MSRPTMNPDIPVLPTECAHYNTRDGRCLNTPVQQVPDRTYPTYFHSLCDEHAEAYRPGKVKGPLS